MQKLTIFKTPLVNGFFRVLFKILTALKGWRVVGERPTEKKYMLIAAPHTSNWDFPSMMGAAFVLGFSPHWMGKHTLFPKGPLGAIMRWFGGIPVERSTANNTVEQMVEQYHQRDELCVIITPEGTRGKVNKWKGGFYHIAMGAGVPIYLAFVDIPSKTVGIGAVFHPTGDYAADLVKIKAFYADKVGFRPEHGTH